MTQSDEVKRLVLNRLIDKYPPGTALNEQHWKTAYRIVWSDCVIDTLRWKLDNNIKVII